MLVCGLALTACHKSDDKPEVPEYTEWTPGTHVDKAMLHYLAANGLRGFDGTNIDDMIKGATRANIGENVILVLHDRRNQNTRLLAIFAGDDGKGKMKVLKEFDVNKNLIDPAVLVEAIGYLKEYAPADSYVLAVGSHGSGWVPSSRSGSSLTAAKGLLAKHGDVQTGGIAPMSIVDDSAGQMDLEAFSAALATGLTELEADKFDMIIFDECLAAGIEVMYELKDKARYAVASVTETWINGMPYAKLVEDIFSEDLVAGGKGICDKFVGHYKDMGETSALTLFDLSKFDDVASVVKQVLDANSANVQTLSVEELRGIQFYDMQIYASQLANALPRYWDLCEYLCAIAPEAEHDVIKAAIMPAAGNFVNYTVTTPTLTYCNPSYNYGTRAIDLELYSGITSYIPTSSITNYQGLTNKYKLTKWYQEAYPQP